MIKVLFGTASFTGGFIGFLLDNIVPGTEYERGLKRWVEVKSPPQRGDERTLYCIPAIRACMERVRCCSYFPLSPTFTSAREQRGLKNHGVKNESFDLKEVKTV